MSNLSQTGVPGPDATASLPSPHRKSSESAATIYVVATIVCFSLAFSIFLYTKQPEKTGPPQPQEEAAGGALPHDHPDTAMASVIQQMAARIEVLRESLEANPGNDTLRLELANALYDLGQSTNDVASFRESQEHYRKYLTLRPGDPDARTDMAYTLYRTGQVDEALAELYKVRKANPRHQQSAFNIGLMYKEKDRPDSVLAYMEITAGIDSTTNAGRAAKQVLNAYKGAH